MRAPAMVLSEAQRVAVEASVPAVCARGTMVLHAVAAAPDHVHVVVSARGEGATVRRLLKRWLSEAMSARWPLAAGRKWWA
jgi:REP element-mobilizing transposase RayT